MSFQKQKSFVLKTIFFSYMANACVRELVRTRDMGNGMYTFEYECAYFYLNVCVFSIACALRWGLALVGEFIYWALLTLSWENIFRYWRYTGG